MAYRSVGDGWVICKVCETRHDSSFDCPTCWDQYYEDVEVNFKSELTKIGAELMPFSNWQDLKYISQQLERNEISEQTAARLIQDQLDQVRSFAQEVEANRLKEDEQKAQSAKMVSRMSSIMHNRFLD